MTWESDWQMMERLSDWVLYQIATRWIELTDAHTFSRCGNRSTWFNEVRGYTIQCVSAFIYWYVVVFVWIHSSFPTGPTHIPGPQFLDLFLHPMPLLTIRFEEFVSRFIEPGWLLSLRFFTFLGKTTSLQVFITSHYHYFVSLYIASTIACYFTKYNRLLWVYRTRQTRKCYNFVT